MGQQFTNAEGEQGEIDVAELQEWYKKFVVECPSGTLFMHEFKRFFGVQDNQEAAEYVENMFRAFDKNGVSAEKVLQSFIYIIIYVTRDQRGQKSTGWPGFISSNLHLN